MVLDMSPYNKERGREGGRNEGRNKGRNKGRKKKIKKNTQDLKKLFPSPGSLPSPQLLWVVFR